MPAAFPETTDLERQVLAHEKVLQVLIACIDRTEPRFIDHPRERFVEPMRVAQHEHDHRETHDHAEEVTRAVMLLGQARTPRDKESTVTDEQRGSPKGRERESPFVERPAPIDRVQLRRRSGIWEVKVDGKFRGDDHQKEHALAAAALLRGPLP